MKKELSEVSSDSGLSELDVVAKLGDLSKLNAPSGSQKTIIQINENWLEDKAKLLNVKETLEKEESRGLQGVDSSELMKKSEQMGQMRTTLRRMEPVIDELEQKIKLKENQITTYMKLING